MKNHWKSGIICIGIKKTVLYFSCKLEVRYNTHRESLLIQPVESNEFYPAEAVDALAIWLLPEWALFIWVLQDRNLTLYRLKY
jgi:hypothetical protein